MKTDIFTDIDDADKQKQQREEARLLYVALTRARDQLYLMGIEEEVKQSSGTNISWYQLIDEGLLASGETAVIIKTQVGRNIGAQNDDVEGKLIPAIHVSKKSLYYHNGRINR